MNDIIKARIILVFLIIISALMFMPGRIDAGERKTRLPILMYHKIGLKKPSLYWVELDVFEKQMEILKKAGFKTVTFPDVEAYLKGEKSLPEKAVLLTFDDGYQDFYLYVYPILKNFGFKATVFIISSKVADGDSSRFDSCWGGEENLSLHLIWPEIREMAEYGIEFGGHSDTHSPLTDENLTDEDLWREIYGCKKIIERKLGREIISFSYPGGRNNQKVRDLVKKAGYKFAVISGGGVQENIEKNDPFAFRRVAVFDQDASSLLSEITKGE